MDHCNFPDCQAAKQNTELRDIIFGDGTDKNTGLLRKIDRIVEWIETRKKVEARIMTAVITMSVTSAGTFIVLLLKLLWESHSK